MILLFNKIIEMGFERVIVAVGLMQKDVKEYLEFVDKALRTSKDLILLDMSRHQPHVIVNEKVIDKLNRFINHCNERKPLNGGFVCSNFSFIIFKEQTNALHCKIYEKQVL